MSQKRVLWTVLAAAACCALPDSPLNAATFHITGHKNDGLAQSNGTAGQTSNETVRLGGSGQPTGTSTSLTYLFELPELPEGDVVLSATLTFTVFNRENNFSFNIDLYGLPFRETATVLASDFYDGTYGGDSSATPLQNDIVLASQVDLKSPYTPKQFTTSDAASLLLAAHLNAQYEAGAESGDFVPLRLSPDLDSPSNYHYYLTPTADHSTPEYRPVLTIETFDGNYAPVVLSVPIQTIYEGEGATIEIVATDANEEDTLTFSTVNLPPFASIEQTSPKGATVTIITGVGDAGFHTFQVIAHDGKLEGSADVSIIVRDPAAAAASPVFEAVEALSASQGGAASATIVVTDEDSASVSLSASNLPSFATFVDNGDMTGTLVVTPKYSTEPQDYIINLTATDDQDNVATLAILVTVEETEFATYYCDPVNGSMSNDGSAGSPWGSLQQLMAAQKSFNPGETIYLLDGYHGEPTIQGSNTDYVFIKAAPETQPRVSRLNFGSNSRYWHVSGLQVSRSFAPNPSRATMVEIRGSNNTLAECEVFTYPIIAGWTAADWTGKASMGVWVGQDSTHITIEDNVIINTSHAVELRERTNHCVVRRNHIQHFSGDGIRALGNDLLFEYNFIADNYKVDDNHDDAFQSWSLSSGGAVGEGVVYRHTIRGNVIMETTDANRPLQGPLQGIGLFDGMFEEWVIENNVILINQWHGISLYGARNCKIINNTVLDQNPAVEPGPTWIALYPHKKYNSAPDNQKSYYMGGGNIVRNNLTTSFNVSVNYGTVDNNVVISTSNLKNYFVNYPYDVRLKEGSPAIDAGNNANAPTVDADGVSRPQGGKVDLGAYEYVQESQANWGKYPVEPGNWVNTGNLMKWIYVGLSPWVYQQDSSAWLYVPAEAITDDGVWAFSASFVRGPSSGESTVGGYPIEDSWIDSPLGWAFAGTPPWLHFLNFNTWVFLKDDAITSGGAWLYVMDDN